MLIGEGEVRSTLGQLARPHAPWTPSGVGSQLPVEGGSVSRLGTRGGTRMSAVVMSRAVRGSACHASFRDHPLGNWRTLKEVRQAHGSIPLMTGSGGNGRRQESS